MNRAWLLILPLFILLLVGATYFMPVEREQADDVRTVVEGFGKELQRVSLLASDARQQIATHYSLYVAPALVMMWQNDPLQAPGRLTSSPWPDRIEISRITRMDDTHYTVEGMIIEASSGGGGTDEAPVESLHRPVSLTVERTDRWRITALTMSAHTSEGTWILSQPDTRGIQFMYPEKLGTTYISTAAPEGWPPRVWLEAGDYSCAEQDEHKVGDRTLCLVRTSEGAAGSTYTTYHYITAQDDFLAHTEFTLRFPQCLNYDEPQQNACQREQSSYDIDGLADRMLASIRMH